MTDFSGSYGDRAQANNFIEQVGFYADRIVIENYPTAHGLLPRIIIRVGWSVEPADPRDLEILRELEEDFGPVRRNVSDAILDVPAGQLHIQGAYLPQPNQSPWTEMPFDVEVKPHDGPQPSGELHPTVKDILNKWRGQAQ